MSQIFDTLKKDNIAQRKARLAVATETSFLIAKIKDAIKAKTKDGVAPEVTDALVVQEVRSYIKQANQTIDAAGDKLEQSAKDALLANIEMAKKYLPPEIDESTINADINEAIEQLGDRSPRAMGKIMGTLKAKYGDAFDGAKVSSLIKKAL